MTPTMLPTDDDLRELIAPLAADEPPRAELEALRRRASEPRPRPRRRMLAALTVSTAATGLALALLPGSTPGPGPTGPGGTLHAAAAVAAERAVPPVADARWRYAKVRNTFTYEIRDGDRVGFHHSEQVTESWVGPKWSGRFRSARGRAWNTGDTAVAERMFRDGDRDPLTEAREGAYAYGDGPLAKLDPATLPHDRAAIGAVLRDGIRYDRWGPYPENRGEDNGPTGDLRASYTTYSFINLLVDARLTPPQRAALLDVLATDPRARDLGPLTDSEGREGVGVALSYHDPGGAAPSYRIIFDPNTSEILEWSTGKRKRIEGLAAWQPDRVETVLEAGYAVAIGDRP
jgi:hypothetical protein